jgi:hypothetical protein
MIKGALLSDDCNIIKFKCNRWRVRRIIFSLVNRVQLVDDLDRGAKLAKHFRLKKTLCISAFVANIIKMERTQDKQVIYRIVDEPNQRINATTPPIKENQHYYPFYMKFKMLMTTG